MIELLLSNDAVQVGLQKARSDLGDFLEATKTSILRDNESAEVGKIVRESLDIFISSYYALAGTLKKSKMFQKEERRGDVIWNYSLSCASTVILNCLERTMGREMDFDQAAFGSVKLIDDETLQGKSAYSFLSNALTGLRSYVNSTGKGGNIVYKLGFYFTHLESRAAYAAKLACSEQGFEKELNQIKPSSEMDKISFRLKSRKRREYSARSDDNGEKVLVGDKLPDELPEYTASSVKLTDVVGNSQQKKELMNFLAMAFHYHTPSRENFLWMDGNGFPEGVLLYGDPGVGKTFMANAIMNEATRIAKESQLDFFPVSLNGHHIASVYQNRSAALLEHYFTMIRKGDRIYAVLIDEFDDLVPLGHDGKLSENARQRLSAFKRVTGNAGALGNYFVIAIANRIDEKDIPVEITDRFAPLFVPGPQTPEEYGQIVRNGLMFKEQQSLIDQTIDWVTVGRCLLQWKKTLEGYGDKEISIGRAYKLITQQLATSAKKPYYQYSPAFGKSPEWHKKFYSKEFVPITQENLYVAIERAMRQLIHSKTHGKPGEYGIEIRADHPRLD